MQRHTQNWHANPVWKKVGQSGRKQVDSPEEIVLGINFSIYIFFSFLQLVFELLRISKTQWALQREGKKINIEPKCQHHRLNKISPNSMNVSSLALKMQYFFFPTKVNTIHSVHFFLFHISGRWEAIIKFELERP